VLDDLLRILSAGGVEPDVVNAVCVAVSEAFTNAVVHGNRENQSKSVSLRVQVNDSDIIADIVDEGYGGVKKIESRKPSTEFDEGGRGIDLIRHFADSYRLTETESGGLRVSLRFLRTGKKISTT
jgi:serine/threonine-protein kinase RsbW